MKYFILILLILSINDQIYCAEASKPKEYFTEQEALESWANECPDINKEKLKLEEFKQKMQRIAYSEDIIFIKAKYQNDIQAKRIIFNRVLNYFYELYEKLDRNPDILILFKNYLVKQISTLNSNIRLYLALSNETDLQKKSLLTNNFLKEITAKESLEFFEYGDLNNYIISTFGPDEIGRFEDILKLLGNIYPDHLVIGNRDSNTLLNIPQTELKKIVEALNQFRNDLEFELYNKINDFF